MDRNSFTETLHEVMKIMQTADHTMDRDEVMAYFKDIELTPQQKNMVYDYLLKPEEETDNQPEVQGEDSEKPEESKALKLYMEEVSDMDQTDDTALICDLLAGKEPAIEALLKVYLKDVLELSATHVHDKISREDLIQEGNLGLFVALKDLCGQKGVKIADVKNKVLAVAEQAMAAYATEQMGEDDREQAIIGKASLVSEAARLLKEQNGTEPTDEELAAYTNMELTEIIAITDFLGNKN